MRIHRRPTSEELVLVALLVVFVVLDKVDVFELVVDRCVEVFCVWERLDVVRVCETDVDDFVRVPDFEVEVAVRVADFEVEVRVAVTVRDFVAVRDDVLVAVCRGGVNGMLEREGRLNSRGWLSSSRSRFSGCSSGSR